MDQGNGTFKQYEDLAALYNAEPKKFLSSTMPKPDSGIFTEGEELEIRGSRFRISKIIRNGLKLELLPRK